jgi:hypothetical protein
MLTLDWNKAKENNPHRNFFGTHRQILIGFSGRPGQERWEVRLSPLRRVQEESGVHPELGYRASR